MKVLGVGWAKTGTTSLASALRALGYRHKTQDISLVHHLDGDMNEIFAVADRFDSFDDWPWLLLYKEFDARYPGSKFVLTKRDPAPWIVSYRKQISRTPGGPGMNAVRSRLYGLPFPDVTDDALVERYERHNRDVRAHFAGREDALLEVDFTAGDGWERLCAFLGRPVPAAPFPHANRAPA